MTLTPDDAMMLRGLYWWGVPTLFACDHDADPANADIALVGIPHSTGNGTTERDQHLGPRAVRDVSAVQRRVHLGMELDPWAVARVRDIGDVPLPEANDNERCIERITEHFRQIDAAGARPVSIGGDHSITGGVLQALGGGRLSGGEPVALLHLDAHTDVYTGLDHFLGARKSAAHWGAYLVDQGHVDPQASVQIGIRGNPRTLDWLEPSRAYGYRLITMAEYRAMGAAAAVEEIRARIGDRPVYVTFDLDCLDPSVAPGVSNLEPGEEGFRVDEAIRLLGALRGLDIVGGDVVCMMPTKDSPNRITALSASVVMFEMIALMADRVRARGGPTPGA
ncbi:MAG: arginase family protein [Pseudomonadota bacterium]